jgi:hypothetical protein
MTVIWKPSRAEIAAAFGRSIPDVVGPGLRVLFCGINPSLYSAAVGHHFARPGNRFWPTLHAAGFTERLLSPFEDATLLERGYGLTNLVRRATATADEFDERRTRRRRPATRSTRAPSPANDCRLPRRDGVSCGVRATTGGARPSASANRHIIRLGLAQPERTQRALSARPVGARLRATSRCRSVRRRAKSVIRPASARQA